MAESRANNPAVRLAEIVAALSVATDLGMGQPLEFALQSCILAVRLGEALGYSDEALREVYYQSLLRYIGCNVDTQMLAAVAGDEFVLRSEIALVDNGRLVEIVELMLRLIRRANADVSPLELMQSVLRGLMTMPQMRASFAGHCEVAQRLAERLGLEPNIVYALGQLYERWDGKGLPNGLKGEAVAPAVLVVTLAQDALIFYRLGGVDAAIKVARDRRGTAYAPSVADCLCDHADHLFSGIGSEPSWETVLRLEPGTPQWLSEPQFDDACQTMADFVDIKSPSTLNHSDRVARLAADAARQAGFPESDVRAIRRAGWLHDLGKTGVSAAILEKSGPLSEREWEKVYLHPYHTERILAHSTVLSQLGALAALHHETLDGSGYYRRLSAAALSPAARLIAVANKYSALLEDRPYRRAASPDDAAAVINREVHVGRLDGELARCVLAAAGHGSPPRGQVAGLSEREIDVLRLLAQGYLTRQIAERLVISPKTADHHIQHIYNKIGLSTRAGATLFAMEHNLLEQSSK